MSESTSVVRELRSTAGMSQPQVAEKSGLSVPYISQIENGVRPLTPGVAAKLAPVFKTTGERLLRGEKSLLAIKAVSELSNLTDDQVKDLLTLDSGMDQVLKALSAGIDVLLSDDAVGLRFEERFKLHMETLRLIATVLAALQEVHPMAAANA